jgi:hypothetical protein
MRGILLHRSSDEVRRATERELTRALQLASRNHGAQRVCGAKGWFCLRKWRVELLVVGYVVGWIPYIALTRAITSEPHGGMTRPLSGLETLPITMIVVMVSMFTFLWVLGWWPSAHRIRVGPLSLAVPTKWTAMAGVGATLILTTVPLSFTFPGVSIPFIQLLMRGDALIVAPLVDKLSGRIVRWYSWVAVVLVAVALGVTIRQRGGLHVPTLCLVTIVLNALGYFFRLMVMTRFAKNSDPHARRRYFVEEQLVACPLVVVTLGALAWRGGAEPLLELRWGFTELWAQTVVWNVLPLGVIVATLGVVAAFILLDKRENTYCVPLERSASVVGGVIAAYVLSHLRGYPVPTRAELIGVALLVAAIIVLSVGPRLGRDRTAERFEQQLGEG